MAGRGVLLSDVEIGKTMALYEEGGSERYIADRIMWSRTVFLNFISNKDNYRVSKSPERPKAFNERDQGRIFRSISREFKSYA